jgi:hypothetical protein
MASTKIWNSTSFTDANANKMVSSKHDAGGTQMMAWRIRYNGAAWECVAGHGNTESISGVSFGWASNILTITLALDSSYGTDYSASPVVVVSPAKSDANYYVKANASSATTIVASFYNIDTGAVITTESTTMDFEMILFGEIG